jgi:AcrR family transcriptional regulator
VELPQYQGPPKVRADAARNRARILEVTETLVAEHGIEGVSMEDVARAACVGTGTLYRRFGDRAGLAFALLDDQTREFQDALISGPPPLGPGVLAAERLRAFGAGYIALLERHSALMLAAILLREAAPALDARFTAESLLATLAPAHHLRMRAGLGYTLEQMIAGWGELVDAVTASA